MGSHLLDRNFGLRLITFIFAFVACLSFCYLVCSGLPVCFRPSLWLGVCCFHKAAAVIDDTTADTMPTAATALRLAFSRGRATHAPECQLLGTGTQR